MNNCYQLAPWADVLYACDRQYWAAYSDRVRAVFRGEPWTINPEAAKVYGLNVVKHEKAPGVSGKSNTICEGGNSGYQAVGLAILFGAARVVLLGYDMQAQGKRLHWHADHQGGLANPVLRKFADWQRNFASLAAQSPVPIVNASRETGLQCFPRLALCEALNGEV